MDRLEWLQRWRSIRSKPRCRRGCDQHQSLHRTQLTCVGLYGPSILQAAFRYRSNTRHDYRTCRDHSCSWCSCWVGSSSPRLRIWDDTLGMVTQQIFRAVCTSLTSSHADLAEPWQATPHAVSKGRRLPRRLSHALCWLSGRWYRYRPIRNCQGLCSFWVDQ
jgi:hypothetical protein